MSIFAVSDGFAFHVKALTAGDDGVGLWVRAGSWSSARENLTDGWIPAPVAAALGPAERWEKLVIARLVERDVERGGYQMRNFLRWNPGREEVLARSADLGIKRAEAGRRGAEARWGRTTDGKPGHERWQNDGKSHGKTMAKNAPDPDPDPDPDPRYSDPLLRAPARAESTPEAPPPSAEPEPVLTLGETFAAEEAKPVGEMDALARSLAAEGNHFGQRCVGYLDGGQALPSAMREKLREILAERAKPRQGGPRRVSVTAEEQALVAVYVAAQKRIRREEVPQLELHALAARRILPDLVTLAKSIASSGFEPTPADVLAHKLETYLRLNDQRLFAEGYPLGLVLMRTDATDLPRPPKRARPAAQRDGPPEEPRPTIRYAGRPGAYDDGKANSATGS